MKHSPIGWFYIVAGLAIGCARTLEAAPVRFAMLTDGPALSDTMRFLREAGCESQALASFKSLASNRTARQSLDLSHFPSAKDGFYDFASVKALADAIPNSFFCGTNSDFNCFDTAFLLAGTRLRTALKPDDLAGPFQVWAWATNREPADWWLIPAATPRDAFAALYEGGRAYGGVSVGKFPQDLRDSRICLTAALVGASVLPNGALTNCSRTVVYSVLQASWRRSGLRFPGDFEVLLVHAVEGIVLRTTHAGLLFPRGREFTYIEKTSLEGEFIRLDLSDKVDIYEWAWNVHCSTNTAVKMFATLNEQIVAFLTGPPPIPTHPDKPSGN